MNVPQASEQTIQSCEQEQPSTEKQVPIEVKLNIPAWMLRDPGPRIDVEDDNIDFQ